MNRHFLFFILNPNKIKDNFPSPFFTSTSTSTQLFLGSKIFLDPKFFWTQNFFGLKNFLEPKFFLDQNFFWTPNFVWTKPVWSRLTAGARSSQPVGL